VDAPVQSGLKDRPQGQPVDLAGRVQLVLEGDGKCVPQPAVGETQVPTGFVAGGQRQAVQRHGQALAQRLQPVPVENEPVALPPDEGARVPLVDMHVDAGAHEVLGEAQAGEAGASDCH
jgi:hypothetical protein